MLMRQASSSPVDVHHLIVVDTKDALLVCPRVEAQTISALVKALEKAG
jgi:hypothetical protein